MVVTLDDYRLVTEQAPCHPNPLPVHPSQRACVVVGSLPCLDHQSTSLLNLSAL